MSNVSSRIITPILSVDIALTLENGTSKSICVKEGEFISSLEYMDNGEKKTISGILKAVKFRTVSSDKYDPDCEHITASYFSKCITVSALVMDCSTQYESKLITVNVKNICGFDSVAVDIPEQGGTTVTARQIELTNDGEYIKWRYTDSEEWVNLVAIADLKVTVPAETPDGSQVTDSDPSGSKETNGETPVEEKPEQGTTGTEKNPSDTTVTEPGASGSEETNGKPPVEETPEQGTTGTVEKPSDTTVTEPDNKGESVSNPENTEPTE